MQRASHDALSSFIRWEWRLSKSSSTKSPRAHLWKAPDIVFKREKLKQNKEENKINWARQQLGKSQGSGINVCWQTTTALRRRALKIKTKSKKNKAFWCDLYVQLPQGKFGESASKVLISGDSSITWEWLHISGGNFMTLYYKFRSGNCLNIKVEISFIITILTLHAYFNQTED